MLIIYDLYYLNKKKIKTDAEISLSILSFDQKTLKKEEFIKNWSIGPGSDHDNFCFHLK